MVKTHFGKRATARDQILAESWGDTSVLGEKRYISYFWRFHTWTNTRSLKSIEIKSYMPPLTSICPGSGWKIQVCYSAISLYPYHPIVVLSSPTHCHILLMRGIQVFIIFNVIVSDYLSHSFWSVVTSWVKLPVQEWCRCRRSRAPSSPKVLPPGKVLFSIRRTSGDALLRGNSWVWFLHELHLGVLIMLWWF